MHSISTSAPLGISFTATQLRAGREVKYFSYTALKAAKSFMSARKQTVFITLSVEEPAGYIRRLYVPACGVHGNLPACKNKSARYLCLRIRPYRRRRVFGFNCLHMFYLLKSSVRRLQNPHAPHVCNALFAAYCRAFYGFISLNPLEVSFSSISFM